MRKQKDSAEQKKRNALLAPTKDTLVDGVLTTTHFSAGRFFLRRCCRDVALSQHIFYHTYEPAVADVVVGSFYVHPAYYIFIIMR